MGSLRRAQTRLESQKGPLGVPIWRFFPQQARPYCRPSGSAICSQVWNSILCSFLRLCALCVSWAGAICHAHFDDHHLHWVFHRFHWRRRHLSCKSSAYEWSGAHEHFRDSSSCFVCHLGCRCFNHYFHFYNSLRSPWAWLRHTHPLVERRCQGSSTALPSLMKCRGLPFSPVCSSQCWIFPTTHANYDC